MKWSGYPAHTRALLWSSLHRAVGSRYRTSDGEDGLSVNSKYKNSFIIIAVQWWKKTYKICGEKNMTKLSRWCKICNTSKLQFKWSKKISITLPDNVMLCYRDKIIDPAVDFFSLSEHDKAYERWMPHINLIYPYLEDVMSHGSKGVFHAESQKILKHLGAVSPFR